MAGLGASLLFTVFVLAEAAFGACVTEWTPSIGYTCLKVSSSTDTWHGAKNSCQSRGVNLASLETKAKESYVKGWLSSTCEKTCSYCIHIIVFILII